MLNQSQIIVAIAEDNEIFAKGLQTTIMGNPLLKYAGTYFNGWDMVMAIPSFDPMVDLVFMDVCMPKMGGIEATKEIKKLYPSVKVVAISMFDDPKLLDEMFQAGADSYLVKDDITIKDLDDLVHKFINGERYISPRASTKYTLHKFGTSSPLNEERAEESYKQYAGVRITPREAEVISYIREGISNQKIAEKLHLSISTIETHKKNIMTKTGTHNSLQIVKWANDSGLFK